MWSKGVNCALWSSTKKVILLTGWLNKYVLKYFVWFWFGIVVVLKVFKDFYMEYVHVYYSVH